MDSPQNNPDPEAVEFCLEIQRAQELKQAPYVMMSIQAYAAGTQDYKQATEMLRRFNQALEKPSPTHDHQTQDSRPATED